ncbi:hypothetical protein LCGC14_3161050 [marine sediment metagenome]|uniref:Uncharacterized protein n=1 Tax=marine sediment metagenome TaxID=412755 RepID=A0A0F8VRC4_9ZZZZ
MTSGFVHVKNLEKYHPKYKDRHLIWCKVYFSMIDGDPEFEMIDEIDKWRYLAFVMLELKTKKPVPLDEKYLTRKGFDLKKRPISKTLQVLHEFIEVRNNMLHTPKKSVPHIRLDYIKKNRIDKEERNDILEQKGEIKEIIIPNWIPKKTWDTFLEMRKKIKAPMTDQAIKLAINKLEKLKEEGYESEDVLNESILNNWKGLFPIKNYQRKEKRYDEE